MEEPRAEIVDFDGYGQARVGAPARARTATEALFAASLVPCRRCGARGPELLDLHLYGQGDACVLTGPCRRCRTPRAFRFRSYGDPVTAPNPPGELGGPSPSEIISPGQLLAELDRLLPEIRPDPTTLGLAEWRASRDANARALTCLLELLKFVPPGAEAIPDAALPPAERAERAARPERFGRAWQAAERDRRLALMERIVADLPRVSALELGDASARREARRAGRPAEPPTGRRPRPEYSLGTLANAVRSGDRATLAAYLDAGGDPGVTDGTRVTLLHMAARRRAVEIAADLLRAGADANARDDEGRTPLFEALDEWVPGGPGVVAGGFRVPAPEAAPDTSPERVLALVRLLLAAGAAVNSRREDYARARSLLFFQTPLALAARAGDVPVLHALLDAGAEVDGRGKYGSTALIAAVNAARPAAVETLLAAGADANQAEDDGATPLRRAALTLATERSPTRRAALDAIVVALLQSGADPHRLDDRDPSLVATAVAAARRELTRRLRAIAVWRDAYGSGGRARRQVQDGADNQRRVPRRG